MKKYKTGDLIGNRALHTRYWHGVSRELIGLGYIEEKETKRGEAKKFKLLKPLPDKEPFEKEVTEKYFTKPMDTIISDAASEIQCVKDDMQSWSDSLQDNEGLSQTSKADEVQSAVDELEYADTDELEYISAEVTKLLSAHEAVLPTSMPTWFSWRSKKQRTGRNYILGDAGTALRCVAEKLEEMLENKDEVQIQHSDKTPATESEIEELERLKDTLNEVADAVENVDCPGMF